MRGRAYSHWLQLRLDSVCIEQTELVKSSLMTPSHPLRKRYGREEVLVHHQGRNHVSTQTVVDCGATAGLLSACGDKTGEENGTEVSGAFLPKRLLPETLSLPK